MNFKRINNFTGWAVCLIACLVYILTTEAGGSLWDCGEFVSSCFKVQIPHPPGAPLFILLGRIAIILTGSNPLTAAKSVNVLNAFASGFSILFLFWTTTHFARKIVRKDSGNEPYTLAQIVIIMGAGAVSAFAYTFTDSFWYSAVEGEVYAMSSFFTAIVFWAILKWEQVADEPRADRWLVFIFFLIGLSIGVHLLCLLCIPAIFMVFYFKRWKTLNYALIKKVFIWSVIIFGVLASLMAMLSASAEAIPANDRHNFDIPMDNTEAGLMIVGALGAIAILFILERLYKEKKEYVGGAFIFLVLGAVVLGIVQIGIIQLSIKVAGAFDVFFVNSLHLPFFSGFAAFFILLAVVLWAGIRYSTRRKMKYLRIALWSVSFCLIGYSTYLTTMIRSNADPAVDMYNVDNPESLVGYLGRDQYGDFPILYGQKFDAQAVDYKLGPDKFQKGKEKYVDIGKDLGYVYMPEDKMVFPRMWDGSGEQGHDIYYGQFLGQNKLRDGSWDIEKTTDANGMSHYTRPTGGDNLRFFASYQVYFMYLRYFFWNFSGKQNDIEGMFTGQVRDGNWISGIPIIDNAMYGDQSLMPDSIKNNKSHNNMLMLPFIFGLIGMFYQFKKKADDGVIAFLLFFMTGFAIIIYLNQPGYQPRERDYAYAGSFYAYAIWIGLAIPYFVEMAGKWDEKLFIAIAWGGGASAFIMLVAGFVAAGVVALGIGFAVLFALVAFGIPYILKYLKNKQAIVYAATLISLFVPIIMGAQEWDDHDRSKKQLARDVAKDYLVSCAPNAILFTFGDNDTYPLWYAQEVEGIRPDIRVINTSLLGIDWYIDQLRYKINQSDVIDVLWSYEQIEGNKRNYIQYRANPAYPENRYYDLDSIMRYYVGSDDPAKGIDQGNGDMLNSYPVKKFSVPVDVAFARSAQSGGLANPDDSVVSSMQFATDKSSLQKGDLAILNIIAANKWKRPIYFTMEYKDLGFGDFLRRDGLSYRLVPVKSSRVNTDHMYDVIMNKFGFGNCNIPGVYYDEENRRHLNIMREACAELAADLASKNKFDSAQKVLNYCDKMMNSDTLDKPQNFPYGLVSKGNDHNQHSLFFLQACYMAKDTALAKKVAAQLKKDLEQQNRYYAGIGGMDIGAFNSAFAKYSQMENSITTQQQYDAAEEYLDNTFDRKQIALREEIVQNNRLLEELNGLVEAYAPKPAINTNPIIKTLDSAAKQPPAKAAAGKKK